MTEDINDITHEEITEDCHFDVVDLDQLQDFVIELIDEIDWIHSDDIGHKVVLWHDILDLLRRKFDLEVIDKEKSLD